MQKVLDALAEVEQDSCNCAQCKAMIVDRNHALVPTARLEPTESALLSYGKAERISPTNIPPEPAGGALVPSARPSDRHAGRAPTCRALLRIASVTFEVLVFSSEVLVRFRPLLRILCALESFWHSLYAKSGVFAAAPEASHFV